MPRSKQDDDVYRPAPGSNDGSGRNSPRVGGGGRRLSYDVYGYGSYEDSSPEASERPRKISERPSRKTSIRDRNFFTDALDDLERSLKSFEDESSLIVHDFVSIATHMCLLPTLDNFSDFSKSKTCLLFRVYQLSTFRDTLSARSCYQLG